MSFEAERGVTYHVMVSSVGGGDLRLALKRLFRRKVEVVLRNVATGESIVLARQRIRKRTTVAPGQVSGNYAAWYRCSARAFDVFGFVDP